MKVAIYARQSKDKKDSLSIETQIDKCIQLCTFKNKEYKLYHDKGFSGKNILRPAFEEMAADIKSGLIDEVIVYRLDRISRNLNDFTSMLMEFEELGCSFVSATESFDTSTPMGRAMMMILAVFAQLERENISERLRDNKMYTVGTLGRWHGGRVPYGYKLEESVEDGKTIKTLTLDENESEVVKMIFEMYLSPTGSIRKISHTLNGKGYKTKDGAVFSSSKISKILSSVFYSSNAPAVYDYYEHSDYILQNDKSEYDGARAVKFFRKVKHSANKSGPAYVVIGDHPHIIDGDAWVRANKKLDNYEQIPQKTSKNTYLAGLFRCGYCGKKMFIRYSKQYMYVCCKTRVDSGDSVCKNKNTSVHRIERDVEKYLYDLARKPWNLKGLMTKRKKVNILDKLNKNSQEIKAIEANIKEQTKAMFGLVDNIKHISNPALLRAIEEESERINLTIENLHKQLELVRSEQEIFVNHEANFSIVQQNLSLFNSGFEKMTLEERQKTIRGIISEITIKGDEVKIKIF